MPSLPKRLKVLSYNIHKGFTAGNRRFVLSKIRDALRELKADVVFLQEVQGDHRRHQPHHLPQARFLAEEDWPHVAYGRNAIYESGHHGNAILSKYPFTFSENIDVSTHRFESRGILHGIIQVPGAVPIHTLCVHLGLSETERHRQVELLCGRINSHVPAHEPLIIGGDFNDWRRRATGTLARKLNLAEAFHALHGKHARSFPSWLPALQLDRVYYRGMAARLAKCMSGKAWSGLSDHSALYTELCLN